MTDVPLTGGFVRVSRRELFRAVSARTDITQKQFQGVLWRPLHHAGDRRRAAGDRWLLRDSGSVSLHPEEEAPPQVRHRRPRPSSSVSAGSQGRTRQTSSRLVLQSRRFDGSRVAVCGGSRSWLLGGFPGSALPPSACTPGTYPLGAALLRRRLFRLFIGVFARRRSLFGSFCAGIAPRTAPTRLFRAASPA